MPGSRRGLGAELMADELNGQAQADGGPGFSLQVMADLSARIGNIAAALDEQNNRTARLWSAIRPIPGIAVPQITTSTGKADYPELLAPRAGYWWFVQLAVAATFTGGTVNLYRGGTGAQDSQIVGGFPQAGYLTYSSTQLPVPPGQRLIFAAQSTTGSVTPSLSVTEVAAWAVPAYLM